MKLSSLRQIGFSFLIAICSNASAEFEPVFSDSATASLDPSIPLNRIDDDPISVTSLVEPVSESLDERVLRLESELNQLRSQPQGNSFSLQESPLNDRSVGMGGLFGSVELTFLKPHLSGAPAAFGVATNRVIDANYATGLRYTLGYANESGLGVRARYWNFDSNSNFVAPFASSTLGIHLDTADAEVTLGQRLCNWDLEVSGGLRYGKLQYTNGTPSLFGMGNLTFEGVGPTAALSGRRILGDSGLSLFGNIRGSMLMGHINNGSLLTNMPRGAIEDEIMTVAENQLGISWMRHLSSTWQLEVRGAWETQFWMSSTLSSDVYGVGSNLALTGPTVAVELRY